MDAFLGRYVPHEDSYLELFFKEIVTPWYRVTGQRAAQVYSRVRDEIDVLKKKRAKIQQKKQQPKNPGSARAERYEVERLPDRLTPEIAVYGKGQRGAAGRKTDRSEIQRYESRITELEQEVKRLKLKGANERNANIGSSAEKGLGKNIIDLEKMCKEKDHQIDELYKRFAEITIEMDQDKEHIRRLQESLQNYRDEVNTLSARLSKMVGDKIRDGNPDITDLSDPNRPTEIGKNFSELYDNEWSDAFEEMNLKDDDRRVRTLLLIMESAFGYCERVNKSQIPAIRNILVGATPANAEGKSDQEIETNTKSSLNLHNMLKDVRKNYALAAAEHVSKSFTRKEFLDLCKTINVKKPGPHLTSFGENCARISWLMLVCDPPMTLETCKNGDLFEGNRYKAYTRSDRNMTKPVVEFTVWPALLLHEGGPIVARGVAQPIDGGQTGKKK